MTKNKFVIHTIQLSKGRKLNDLLDISRKSGEGIFAPTWVMVKKYKKGELTEAEYAEMYHKLMKLSIDYCQDRWVEIIESGSVTFGCYCRADIFCHRLLLAEYFEKVAKQMGYKVTNLGEIK